MFLAKTLSIRLNNDLESGHILLFEKRKKNTRQIIFHCRCYYIFIIIIVP